jgi:hypothetical protein
MKRVLVIALLAGCATAPGPKRPDESHRVPVNRTIPAEAGGAAPPTEPSRQERRLQREGEVEWR